MGSSKTGVGDLKINLTGHFRKFGRASHKVGMSYSVKRRWSAPAFTVLALGLVNELIAQNSGLGRPCSKDSRRAEKAVDSSRLIFINCHPYVSRTRQEASEMSGYLSLSNMLFQKYERNNDSINADFWVVDRFEVS